MSLARKLCYLGVLTSLVVVATSSNTGWTANALEKACPNIDSARICNPDSILSERTKMVEENDVSSVTTALRELETRHELKCSNDRTSTEIQMAVVIVNNIDMNGKNHYNDDYKLNKAKSLAISLHDAWGVGNIQCNGSGILLFLSIRDRVAYISTSQGLTRILTKTRIDHIIDEMKPFLRDEEYSKAIVNSIHYIMEYLDQGPPSFGEQYFSLLFIGTLAGAMIGFDKWNKKKKTEYVKVKSHLNQIDHDRAMALMGKYQCSSCPICLEDFKSPADADTDTQKGIASNDEKDKESPPASPAPAYNLETNTSAGIPIPYIGNDNKPLQLLRCGHAFDKSCWEKWISTPSRNIHQCPICKQDIVASSYSDETRLVSHHRNQEVRPFISGMNNNNVGNNMWRTPSFSRQQRQQIYLSERNFRIQRLHHRYPNYIQQSNVDRWTQENYDGTMTQDNDFVHKDPDPVVHNQSSSSYKGGSSSSFGGGCSGGGGGGTW